MGKVVKKLIVWTCLLAIVVYGVARIWPEKAADVITTGFLAYAGLDQHEISVNGETIHYLEGGEGEAIIFFHGIFARKEHWIEMSRYLSGDFRVVLLDLPGFGSNDVLGARQYDLETQVRNAVEAIDEIGIETYHLAANSMGAHLAAEIAIRRPKQVQSVSFIGGPLGVRSPQQSDMEIALQQGHAPLVVNSLEDYDARMAWLFPRTPFIPGPLNKRWANAEVSNGQDNQRIWDEVAASEVKPLQELAPRITQPTLIVWCTADRIFHHSGADVLQQALQNGVLVSLNGCGHLPMLDSPKDAGLALLNFLNGLDT